MSERQWMAALVDGGLTGRLSRRQALHRAAALGIGAAALTALPGRLSMATGALAQEGGELIVGASQEAVNYNPLLYANTGPETLPDVLMFDSQRDHGKHSAQGRIHNHSVINMHIVVAHA